MKTFIRFVEELTQTQKDIVATWKPRTKQATEATDHYFGKGVEEKTTPLEGTVDKSEIHRAIERHLGRQIHSDDYKSGITQDEHGRQVKIGKLLGKTNAPDELKRGFENDSTRQAKSAGGLTVTTTRSAVGVAGQTSGNQSWEQQSCKNFETGCNRHYLPHEVEHGTVVSYLKDHTGKEIARATLQPYTNDAGHTVYHVDSHYGIDHAGFKAHVQQVAKDLSGEHKGGSLLYSANQHLYNDSGVDTIIHPNATSAHIDKALNDSDPDVRSTAIRHPNATSAHIDKALNDSDITVRIPAIHHPNVTSAHIDKVLENDDSYVRALAIEHPNATSANIDKALNDKENMQVRMAAIRHPNATSAHIDKALNDSDSYVRRAAIRHPNATSAHIDKALNDSDSGVRLAAERLSNKLKESKYMKKTFKQLCESNLYRYGEKNVGKRDRNEWAREKSAGEEDYKPQDSYAAHYVTVNGKFVIDRSTQKPKFFNSRTSASNYSNAIKRNSPDKDVKFGTENQFKNVVGSVIDKDHYEKHFGPITEEVLDEVERVVIKNPGHIFHDHSGVLLRSHIDGTVDVQVMSNGTPTVVRVDKSNVAIREDVESLDEIKFSTVGKIIKHSPKIVSGLVGAAIAAHNAEEPKETPKAPTAQIAKKVQQSPTKKINEKITASTSLSTIENDFQDSDAPQFAGKSKEKKHEMAVAAYLEMQRKAKSNK